jgi:glycosyltransferase involved in cell wall biosynthesis
MLPGDSPMISVLLPAYNAEATIREAITSLERQTFEEFEIIAVDDGSSDETGAILEQIADPRLRLIRIPHSGLIPALNIGLNHCTGDLIARMDADDVCHPERLRLQSEFMAAHPEVSVCGCLVRSFPRSRVKAGFLQYESWLNSLITHEQIARDIFVESPLAHPSVTMRAEELRALGGYREMGWPEDYDLWLRFFMAGKRFAKVPRTLLFWRESEHRLTFTDSRYSVENFLRLKAHFLAKLTTRPVIVWGAGMMGRRLIKHLVRERIRPIAVIDIDPKKIGGHTRGIPIVPPEDLENHPDAFVISAVGSEGARDTIRARLAGTGRHEKTDFVCAA